MYSLKQMRSIPMSLYIVLIYSVASSVILLPLLIHSTFVSGSDVGMHIFSAQQFSDALHQGVLYPRWLGEWYGGYGAPMGIAYPPLTYYSVALLSLVNISTVLALKIILWITLTLSGIFMYKLVRLYCIPAAAILAGLFYQIAPYRTIDLYERTA